MTIICDKSVDDRIKYLSSFPNFTIADDLKVLMAFIQNPYNLHTVLLITQQMSRYLYFKMHTYHFSQMDNIYDTFLCSRIDVLIDIEREEFEMLHIDGNQNKKKYCIKTALEYVLMKYINLYKEYYLEDYKAALMDNFHDDGSKKCIDFVTAERKKYELIY